MLNLVSLLDRLSRPGSNRSAVIIDDDFSANFIAIQPFSFKSTFYPNHSYLSIPVRMAISKYSARGIRPGSHLYQVSINSKSMETMIYFSAILPGNNDLILEKANISPGFHCSLYRPFALSGRTCPAANHTAPIREVCCRAFVLHNRPPGYLIRLFFDLPIDGQTIHWQTVKSRCLAAVQLHSTIELRQHHFLFLTAKEREETLREEKKKTEDKKVITIACFEGIIYLPTNLFIVPVFSLFLPIKTRTHNTHFGAPRSRERVIPGMWNYPVILSTLFKGELLLFPALRLHHFLFLAAKEREETRRKEGSKNDLRSVVNRWVSPGGGRKGFIFPLNLPPFHSPVIKAQSQLTVGNWLCALRFLSVLSSSGLRSRGVHRLCVLCVLCGKKNIFNKRVK
jgi:hypothetical protein